MVQAVTTEMELMDPTKSIDVDSLPTLPELGDLNQQVEVPAPVPRRRVGWWLALAATAAIAATAWLLHSSALSPPQLSYATAVGEQRSVKLTDGSVVTLNTDSRVELRFSAQAREIQLSKGEAVFVAQHDAARPFAVVTDTARVVALGTEFNVYQHHDSTRVTVIEGAVLVSATRGVKVRLSAGEAAEIRASQILKTKQAAVQRDLAWRTRKLVFSDRTLAEAVEEFNRYNKLPIRVEGIALGRRSISGVFDADDSQPLLDFLKEDPHVEVVRTQQAIVIRDSSR